MEERTRTAIGSPAAYLPSFLRRLKSCQVFSPVSEPGRLSHPSPAPVLLPPLQPLEVRPQRTPRGSFGRNEDRYSRDRTGSDSHRRAGRTCVFRPSRSRSRVSGGVRRCEIQRPMKCRRPHPRRHLAGPALSMRLLRVVRQFYCPNPLSTLRFHRRQRDLTDRRLCQKTAAYNEWAIRLATTERG